MREIEFRALSLNGSWHVGLLAQDDRGYFISNDAGRPFAYQARPETIGQFTGLFDKNGKKVYEGDIVQFGNDAPVAVEFAGGQFQMAKETPYQKSSLGIFTDKLEVVGNIYENPELLEQK